MIENMKVEFGRTSDIDSWMRLVRKVSWNFPGLETEQSIDEHKIIVLKFMNDKRALCVKNEQEIVGVLLYSRKYNMICCLAVDPAYRKRGIASLLLREAIDKLDRDKDITVSTFRENDVKGIAPRKLYKKFGFEEGELIEEFGYPNQRFVLHANICANNVPIVVVRESKEEDLTEILHLYLYLHEKSVPEESEQLRSMWENIMNENNHHLIVCEVDGKIVASCVCVVIPNLTRNVRPYAFVENVVTHGDYRKKGYATDCLNYAKHIAKENNCYKMMLLTGSKEESTLNFYRNAGYNSTDKTAFIQWIDM